MSVRFEFATAGRIVFGAGARREIPGIAAAFHRRALVVTGTAGRGLEELAPLFAKAGVSVVAVHIGGEPTTADARAAAETARKAGCGVVIGLGGGSVIDAAKAAAALLTNPGDLMKYLEVVGHGRPLTEIPAPCIAAPTTAGTGSEVTRNAVLASPEHGVKVSLRHTGLLPRAAVIDPELTASMPQALTAATGLDALTQLMEAFVSARAQPLTDGLCREGLRHAGAALEAAWRNGADTGAREAMCIAALFGGLALANAGLGAVHGFAGPLGGLFPAPHGMVCAALLAPVMETNLHALRARAPGHTALARYDEVGRLLTGRADAAAADGVARVRALCALFGVPPLTAFGMTAKAIPTVVGKARQASSMKGNPIALTDLELAAILKEAL